MKRLLSLALCAILLCCVITTTAFAENESLTSDVSTFPIQARYTEFSMVYAGLVQTSNGFYHVEGGAATHDSDLLINVTVTIEGCHADGVYRPVQDFQWSSSGYYSTGTQAIRDLSGGAYRAHTVAKCYRNGMLLETVEAYSNIVNVPYN